MRLILTLLVAFSPLAVQGDDNWPQWRGPNAQGVAAGDFPVEFSGDEGVAWKADVPGVGSSSPVVWDDSIFVTASDGGEDTLLCYGFDGKERWRKPLGPGDEGKHRNGSGANPSPVTDGKHVVSYFKSGRVACHDFAGKELWQTNLQDKYGKDTLWWDLGTSPILAGGNVIIAVIQAGDSYLVALDPATGKEVWKEKRQYERPEESDQAYTTPQVANVGGREVIVTWGADHLTGHDAKSGKLIWECAGFNPADEGYWRVIASQAMNEDVAVVPYGRGKFVAGVKLDGAGDVTKANRLWEKQGVGVDVPTPVIKDGKVYLLEDAGKVTCLDVNTGDELWSGSLPRDKDKFYASPIVAGDKLYCVREDGALFVLGTGDKFELLAENDMGERVIATPVPVRDSLLIRGAEHLMRITGNEAGPAATE